MKPFANRVAGNAWVVPVSIMGVILGVLFRLAWITEDTRKGLDPDQERRLSRGSIDTALEYQKVSQEVAQLREENTKLQNAMANTTNQTKVLNDSLQQVKDFAGLTAIEGPGIIVTLRDFAAAAMDGISQGNAIIHDVDVLKVVNELWASGAEAISVNGHRVSSRTSFRCVGPVIHVDNIPISSPVVIRAIGDSSTLRGGLTLPLSVLAEIRQTGDPSMVSIETVERQVVPAYAGSTIWRFGKTAKETK